jgi:formamidopyrimidine-DNA glycosylase
MPELPEVENVVQSLQKLKNKTINKVQTSGKKLREDIPKNIESLLKGKKIIQIRRRAKYIVFELSDEEEILAHLGMTGKFEIFEAKDFKNLNLKNFPSHTHAIFDLGDKILTYNDTRRFGLLMVGNRAVKHLANLGVEPLSEAFNVDKFLELTSQVKTPIKLFLLKQDKIAGLGNIYVCEALFRAKISPLRAAGEITNKEAKKLVETIKLVLKESIINGGTTLKDYRKADGSSGNFQNKLQVYGRKNDKCFVCQHNILHIIQGGRSTFYCVHCQK